MSLSLKENQALTELAESLYEFLPGKPHPYANQSLSFPGVAAKLGLERYWPGGSKMPAIAGLLRSVLEQERSRFCSLIVAVVQEGILYRKNKTPVAREDVEKLNSIILRLGFKIPELHDSEFLSALPRRIEEAATSNQRPSASTMSVLRTKLVGLTELEPVQRGFAFEKFLSEFFDSYGLVPRDSFRLAGEQIDGSFSLDGEIYLLEARWRNAQAAISDLLTFSGKISGKAQWSRGLFVSYSGFTNEGLQAFGRGRATNFIAVDGYDLHEILSRELDLREVLRSKIRRAAETNQPFVMVRDLFPAV